MCYLVNKFDWTFYGVNEECGCCKYALMINVFGVSGFLKYESLI